jgi:hypothetical protein
VIAVSPATGTFSIVLTIRSEDVTTTPAPAGVNLTAAVVVAMALGRFGAHDGRIEHASAVGADLEPVDLAAVALGDEGAQGAALEPRRDLHRAVAEAGGEVDEVARAVGLARAVREVVQHRSLAGADEQAPLLRQVHAVGRDAGRELLVRRNGGGRRVDEDVGHELRRNLSGRERRPERRQVRRAIAQHLGRIARKDEQVAGVQRTEVRGDEYGLRQLRHAGDRRVDVAHRTGVAAGKARRSDRDAASTPWPRRRRSSPSRT